jgi:hypothetical protein
MSDRKKGTAAITLLALLGIACAGLAQQPAASPPLGVAPPAAQFPRLEFAFEEHVTLAPATVVGDTAWGHRQFIAITGGTVAGPKFRGTVMPGGWDYQLRLANGCSSLSADYFLRAEDGTIIRVLNQGVLCPPGGERSFFTPKIEAPKGAHEWLSRATFVATLEADAPAAAPAAGAPVPVTAIRIRFFQVK